MSFDSDNMSSDSGDGFGGETGFGDEVPDNDWDEDPVVEEPKKPEPKKEEKPKKVQKPVEEEDKHSPPPEKKPVLTKAQQKKLAKEEKNKPQPINVDVKLRSPICVIMGHVDTGKTKLLDKIRRTNVQTGEAGGITQQIGATYFPVETLRNMTTYFAQKYKLEYKLPGLLIIDTPGHESFTNLRSRGSSLCDIAILVVDIMHGLESQTKESIELLKKKKSMFIIALNKIDRISDWKETPNSPFELTFKKQSAHAQDNFKKRLAIVTTEFMEIGLNIKPYFQMKFSDKAKITEFPVVPTSAISGEGIPDLLMLVQLLTQTRMQAKLASKEELQCTVLEVKIEEGIGTTLDVILVNGELHVNDTIIIAGINGPIVTHIRALLTPQPLRELRVKSEWVHHQVIYAAMGCKIAAPELEGAIAGSELFVASDEDEVDELMDKVNQDVNSIFDKVDKTGAGILVQASTLGSLEALLCFLESKNYKVSHVGIGPVHRKDVLSISHMVEKDPKYAVILAFDVPITTDARNYATENGVHIFDAQIIYHLTDQYEQYLKDLAQKQKDKARQSIVYPAIVQFLPDMCFNRSRPMIIGVRVIAGTLKKGTPLMTTGETPKCIGFVENIKFNNNETDSAATNQEVSISVKAPSDWTPIATKDILFNDKFCSRMNREIINTLKTHFRDELKREDWEVVREIKTILHIQ